RVLPELPVAQETLAAAQKAVADAKAGNAPEHEIQRLERTADSAEWGVRLAGFKAEHPGEIPLVGQAPVQVMQIGPLVIVGIPGELFVEYGLEMKHRVKQGKNRPMILAGYANDYLGYLVTPRAVHTGGYEQATARLEASAPRAMTEAAMAWVDAGVR
ncbi:MAG: neutral/alkaline non-lysosomal ceramidase N-terminal domain-containing protein, partial [Candidatus Hydrogenedentes bacterium]|nr:neutral/alkaline non-lysosomal ceramidase N-terminal domain-containing protein [Candidatus Hydrogenedentota bacterium]